MFICLCFDLPKGTTIKLIGNKKVKKYFAVNYFLLTFEHIKHVTDMRHIIDVDDLSGVFELILASSTKGRKRLVIETTIRSGIASSMFVVKIRDDEENSEEFANLAEAIEKYNSI